MPFLTRPHSIQVMKDCFWQKQFWILEDSLRYEDSTGVIHEVPAGFKHDFASVPRIFWPILSPTGRYSLPSVLHDYNADDLMFYEAMMDEKVEPWLARIMYHAVALDGSGLKQYKEQQELKSPLGD